MTTPWSDLRKKLNEETRQQMDEILQDQKARIRRDVEARVVLARNLDNFLNGGDSLKITLDEARLIRGLLDRHCFSCGGRADIRGKCYNDDCIGAEFSFDDPDGWPELPE